MKCVTGNLRGCDGKRVAKAKAKNGALHAMAANRAKCDGERLGEGDGERLGECDGKGDE